MINPIKYFFLIVLFSMISCSKQNKNEISELVSDIQQRNIPDQRLLYWDVEIRTGSDSTIISGATVSEKAYSELQTLAVEKTAILNVELLPTDRFNENPWGIVTLSVCNIRGKGSHSAELVTQALMGTPVEVYQKVDGWYLIQTPDLYFGWVDDVAVALKTNAELAEWKRLDKVLYNKHSGFAYSKPDENSPVESDLILADLLSSIISEEDFYKILFADGRTAYVKKEDCITLDGWKKKRLSLDKVLLTATDFKGLPYLWGGTSAKMVDCSGFTKSVFYLNGVILQRDASQQTLYGELVETKNGYQNLQAGDLVFFGRKATENEKEKVTHVGLCLGNQEFIHASGKVRINSLDKTSENYTEYYESAFVRARRIVGNVDGVGIVWIVDNEFYRMIL